MSINDKALGIVLGNDPANQADLDAILAQLNTLALQATALAIKAKTDLITNDPATQTTLNAVKLKTDNIPASPALESSITTLQANIGDFQARANLKSALAYFGLPDAAVSFYTALVTNRLDHATYGLSALQTLIGSITDDEADLTLYGLLYIVLKHLHSADTFLYPSGQNSTVISKAAGVWPAYPTPTQFIAANAITSPFDLHFISITGITANGEYEIGVYEGAPGAEVLRHEIPMSRTSVQAQEGRFPILTKYFNANTRISLALRGSPAGAESAGIKISGHKY